jgi:hypothetical protein
MWWGWAISSEDEGDGTGVGTGAGAGSCANAVEDAIIAAMKNRRFTKLLFVRKINTLYIIKNSATPNDHLLITHYEFKIEVSSQHLPR